MRRLACTDRGGWRVVQLLEARFRQSDMIAFILCFGDPP